MDHITYISLNIVNAFLEGLFTSFLTFPRPILIFYFPKPRAPFRENDGPRLPNPEMSHFYLFLMSNLHFTMSEPRAPLMLNDGVRLPKPKKQFLLLCCLS